MNTNKHTALPWVEAFTADGHDSITSYDGKKTICVFPTGFNANADYVLHCVNAHDELIAALKMIAECKGGEAILVARKYAREALAQAGEA